MDRGFCRKTPKRKGPLERPKRAWDVNIKMYLREIGWGCMDWIHLAEDRDRWRALVNIVMNLRVGKFLILILLFIFYKVL
jgi:hypothetical protein